MKVVLCLIGYAVVGLAILPIAIRVAPDSYTCKRKKADGGVERALDVDEPLLYFTPLFWPFAIFVLVGAMIARATLRVINKGESTRAELAKELADAKKEIDDLLRSK